MDNPQPDKKAQAQRMMDAFEKQKATGKITLHFKEGELKGGTQETSF